MLNKREEELLTSMEEKYRGYSLDIRGSGNLCYAVIDDFLPIDLFRRLSNEMPQLHETSEVKYFSELSKGKSIVKSLAEDSALLSRTIIPRVLGSHYISSKIQRMLNSKNECISLEQFDDTVGHSFFHRMKPGGFLGMHVDRSYLPKTKMVKVGNALLYLSPTWKDEYGGHLMIKDGLFSRDRRLISYRPNRLVLLVHSSSTFHCVTEISKAAPERFSAYMDYYLPLNFAVNSALGIDLWKHETVYAPQAGHLFTFLRGRAYIKELFNYFRRVPFCPE
jgi:Rps23 Pro-64 3,4-dihydroxylase Tpa1-like proline 4-hydroxylase